MMQLLIFICVSVIVLSVLLAYFTMKKTPPIDPKAECLKNYKPNNTIDMNNVNVTIKITVTDRNTGNTATKQIVPDELGMYDQIVDDLKNEVLTQTSTEISEDVLPF